MAYSRGRLRRRKRPFLLLNLIAEPELPICAGFPPSDLGGTPLPVVALGELADFSVNFLVRPWVNASD